nr:hypothetical protein GCM10020063_023440 [Dactylosporangium thailandense]
MRRSGTGSANSSNALIRSMGSSVAADVIGVVLSLFTTNLGGLTMPSQNGFRVALLIGCGVAPAAAIAVGIPACAPVVDERRRMRRGRRPSPRV